jgi:hypothetical protein
VIPKGGRADSDANATEGLGRRVNFDKANLFDRRVVLRVHLAALKVQALATIIARVGPEIATQTKKVSLPKKSGKMWHILHFHGHVVEKLKVTDLAHELRKIKAAKLRHARTRVGKDELVKPARVQNNELAHAREPRGLEGCLRRLVVFLERLDGHRRNSHRRNIQCRNGTRRLQTRRLGHSKQLTLIRSVVWLKRFKGAYAKETNVDRVRGDGLSDLTRGRADELGHGCALARQRIDGHDGAALEYSQQNHLLANLKPESAR